MHLNWATRERSNHASSCCSSPIGKQGTHSLQVHVWTRFVPWALATVLRIPSLLYTQLLRHSFQGPEQLLHSLDEKDRRTRWQLGVIWLKRKTKVWPTLSFHTPAYFSLSSMILNQRPLYTQHVKKKKKTHRGGENNEPLCCTRVTSWVLPWPVINIHIAQGQWSREQRSLCW